MIANSLIRDKQDARDQPAVALSPREHEVLHLLGQGLSARQSADILGIGIDTVNTHRNRIKKKLGFKSLSELQRYAFQRGNLEGCETG